MLERRYYKEVSLMCQPYPLGRCVTGASIELTKAQFETMDAREDQRKVAKEYESGAAAYSNFFNDAEGDEPELEDFWNAAESAMAKMSAANLRVMNADRELDQKQLLVDSTDTGYKKLKESTTAPDQDIRLANAESQREWTSRIRKAVKDESASPGISPVAISSHKSVLYSRMLQEETANYEASQEFERRYSGSVTSLSESIAKMETEEMDNKDEQIEILAKVRNEDRKKSRKYSLEMAMHAARIKDLTTALKDLDSPTTKVK
jgi:hypothetical protein